MSRHLMTTSEVAELSERVDQWADGEPGIVTIDDVSRLLAEYIELRRRVDIAVSGIQEIRDSLR
jgi:hypothetical protein